MVLDVVPKVLQGLWVPKPRLFLTMPSMKLDKMAVGVTKGVEDGVLAALGSTTHEVNMSHSTRDEMITSIIKTLYEAYPEDIWRKMLNSFSPQLLHHVVEVTAEQITTLFRPRGNQEDTMSLPEEPTNFLEELTSLPEEPTSLPEEPTSLPEEPTSLPEEPTSLPEEPKSLPEESTSLPEEPTSLPEEPTSLLKGPTCLPEEPTSLPEEPTSLSEQSAVKVEESCEKKKSRMNRFIRWMQKRLFTSIHPQ
ncbi:zonadhesin-like [Gouania willdenowi]|uniref:zonadhesin-like n=1 Tax=Gouania willdenowi TaxID=441366 RepID=UPI001054EF59|nr:zonadhesin-like [Gouania willdenowi]